MLAIVVATAAVGFLASVVLLWVGLRIIWARYALAVAIAYAAFLVLVRLWLWLSRDTGESDLDLGDAMDAADIASEALDLGSSGGGGDLAGLDGDAEGCLVVAIAAIVLAVAAAAAGYFVLTAPTFFAEVLLDGALSVGLYRRVKTLHRRHWLESAFRHTWMPFAAVAGLFAFLGWAMADYSPGADSIGDVWETMLGR
jgi:hypothetical protein